MNFKTFSIIFALLITRAAYSGEISIAESPAPDAIPLVANNHPSAILIEPHDAKVVTIAANLLADDIQRVTSQKPTVSTELNAKGNIAIIIGTVGQSQLIDDLIANHKLDISPIKGKWEAYLITAIPNRGIVIAGSDRRGTAFGVFTLSEAIGVSPWYFWADVPATKKSQLFVSIPQPVIDRPAVKYRGIFINDEDWGLLPWATKTFDTEAQSIGPKTYRKVFELMLRLKANYFWPAMHPRSKPFNFFPENKQLADDYAIVMSSSHAEPMLRNNTTEYDLKTRGPWDYDKNRDNILTYWEQRLIENGHYENVYTIGMRGIHDSAMPGGGTLQEKVARLQRVLDDQRDLIARDINKDPSKVPQQFVPYKEVLPLYQHGLKVPDDVTLVWPDDNFGYIRRLSTPAEQKRQGGAGVYYHLSYYGPPEDYLWLESTPPALTWEEMTRAYDCGARNIWVVNVGDIKPAEKGITFFLNLAWNPKQYDENCQLTFLKEFARKNFGGEDADEIAAIWDEYYRLNFYPRPEHTPHATFTWAEAQARLAKFKQLVDRANTIYDKTPSESKDAAYELIVYPVRCSAAMNEKQLYAAHVRELRAGNSADAEKFATLAAAAQNAMDEETRYYNDTLAHGKWKHVSSDQQRKERAFKAPDLKAKPATTRPVQLVSLDASRAIQTGGWTIIPGLGEHGSVIAATAATDSASLQFDFTIDKATDATIAVHCLPTHAVDDQHQLRYAISLDDGSWNDIDIDALEFSDLWKQNVLRNEAIGRADCKLAAGRHTLTLRAVDPAIVFDHVTIEKK